MASCFEEQKLWLLFEYIDQGSLFNFLHITKKSMSLKEIVNTSSEIAKGMAFVHEMNIIHLDLKSKNILLGKGGVKVKKLVYKYYSLIYNIG
jgi:serine/threonine protein kinase